MMTTVLQQCGIEALVSIIIVTAPSTAAAIIAVAFLRPMKTAETTEEGGERKLGLAATNQKEE